MSTVQTFQGVNENQKLSSRVLAPPGGKCSDLFGSVEEPTAKKHQKSDPFRAEVNSPLRNRQAPDTKHRLGLNEGAGAVQETPTEAVKEVEAPVKEVTQHNKENVNVDESDEDETSEEVKTVNDTEEEGEKGKVEEKSDDLPKRRVPPGGFSSKLW